MNKTEHKSVRDSTSKLPNIRLTKDGAVRVKYRGLDYWMKRSHFCILKRDANLATRCSTSVLNLASVGSSLNGVKTSYVLQSVASPYAIHDASRLPPLPWDLSSPLLSSVPPPPLHTVTTPACAVNTHPCLAPFWRSLLPVLYVLPDATSPHDRLATSHHYALANALGAIIYFCSAWCKIPSIYFFPS
jgi:hypothetical protein